MQNSIFEINSEIDDKLEENNPEPDWKSIIYGWMSEKFIKKHNKIKHKYINKELLCFFDGLKHEFGVDCEIDHLKAFSFYQKGCELNEPFSLFKMYTIMKKYASKYNIQRDRDKEILTLLMSMAYSDSHYLFNFESIYNIEIIHEIAIILEIEEDTSLEKTIKLFDKFLSKEYESIYPVDDINFCKGIFLLKFYNSLEEKAFSISLLHNLADEKCHMESCYKIGSLMRREDNSSSLNSSYMYFEKCYENKYYKAYSDYSFLLYKDKNIKKCKEVLKEGMENGYPKNMFYYYDLVLTTIPNFESLECIEVLKSLLDLLLKDLVCGNFFSIFEFIYLQNMIKKYYDPSFIGKTKFQEEIFNILNKLFGKNSLPTSYKELEIEIILSLAYYNYIGFQGKRNFVISEMLFKKAFKLARNYSYKRFCYSYIFKIRKKRYNLALKSLDSIFVKEDYDKCKNQVDVLRNKLTKTSIKMQNLYNDSFDSSKLNQYSSSYFYYLAKIYENGYGAEKNRILKGIFKKMDEDIKEIKLKTLDDSKEKSCEICYINDKHTLFFPCKHYVSCKDCASKILKEFKSCPICRTKILLMK